jgi:hypothetical protein
MLSTFCLHQNFQPQHWQSAPRILNLSDNINFGNALAQGRPAAASRCLLHNPLRLIFLNLAQELQY